MKILMIGPGIFGLYGALHYSSDKKLRNGLARCGHHVVNVPHHDISDSVFGLRAIGVPIANYNTARVARYLEPNIVILYLSHLVSIRTLYEIKSRLPETKFVNIEVDPLGVKAKVRRNTELKEILDVVFLTSGGEFISALRDEGLDVAYLPNPTDTSIETDDVRTEERQFKHDLIYLSSAPSSHKRWDLINRVKQAEPGLRVGTFGANNQRVLGEDYARLLRSSRAALNWNGYNEVELCLSSRVAQLFGYGSCVCMSRATGYQRFLGPNDAVWFDDADELATNLKAVLADGSDREIALSGQKKYRQLFNETRISDYIVKRTMGEDTSEFEWNDI